VDTEAPLFILGVERSGSTWLSNIFDASEEVLFYMEPFAPFNEVFRGFPSRLTYLDGANAFLEEVVSEGFGRLRSYKYPLFDRHDAGPWRRRAAHAVMTGYAAAARLARMGKPVTYTRYQQLNLNRLRNEELSRVRKLPEHCLTCIKELRLNFKVKLLADLFPGARFVVIIRNPLSQAYSAHKLFERNSLIQLRRHLYAFVETASRVDRFEKYRRALASLDEDTLLHRFVTYWFINYNTLLEDLEAIDGTYRIVTHEELSERPQAVARDLFAFAGLSYGEAVERYIEASTTASSDGPKSDVDTARNSRTYYRQALKEARAEVGDAVQNAVREFGPLSTTPLQELDYL